MKKIIAALLSVTMVLSVCSCKAVKTDSEKFHTTKESSNNSAHSKESHDVIAAETATRFAVEFDPNEEFLDEPSRIAAERIDPIIQKAVKILNTIPEKDIDILECDYSKRPKEKDKLEGDVKALEWYDFIYQKMRNFERFSLNPADYGGEEELYFPFYTAETALMADHKEIFLAGATWVDDEGTIYPIYFMPREWVDNPCEDLEEVRNTVAVYYRIIDRIFEKMPQNLTDYEKAYYFILVISLATDYRIAYTESAFPPYDTLVLGHTVCVGYAQTFYRLCSKAGISAWYCEGMTTEEGNHAWNRIDTAEGPLYIDITLYDKKDISDHYLQGESEYLFMTQQDYDFYGYTEGVFVNNDQDYGM